jgi:hypothetical protein
MIASGLTPGVNWIQFNTAKLAWQVTAKDKIQTFVPTSEPTAALNPSLTSSSAWGFESSLSDAYDYYWTVDEIILYSSSDCSPTSKIPTLTNSTTFSSFYDSDPYYGPYNAFDSNPSTSWTNEPDSGYWIAYDFTSKVNVQCVELVQNKDEYVQEAELW